MDYSIILSIASALLSASAVIISAVINSRASKKAQNLLQNHEKQMHILQSESDQQKRYDEHSVHAIANYLSAAKVFLGSPYHEEYAVFNRVSGEVLMYVPQELIKDTQSMTRMIDDIFHAPIWNDNDGRDLRRKPILDAQEHLYRLSEIFSNLGFKPPINK